METKARIVVTGNVQGMGYRVFVKQLARMLGLKGLLRNLEDGGVEVFVEGPYETVKRLVERMFARGNPKTS
ncbi:MAG: acylphosphatase [Candidatus Bathyarchaeia archaeon]